MSAFENLAEGGIAGSAPVSSSNLSLLDRATFGALSELAIKHSDVRAACATCPKTDFPKSDLSDCDGAALQHGQAPKVLLLQFGTTTTRPLVSRREKDTPSVFRASLSRLFRGFSEAAEAAILYAHKHLKVETVVVYASNTVLIPRAERIIKYFQNPELSKEHESVWLRAVTPIYNEANDAAKKLAEQTQSEVNPSTLLRLVKLGAMRQAARQVVARVRGNGLNTVAAFADSATGQLLAINPEASLMDIFKQTQGAVKVVREKLPAPPTHTVEIPFACIWGCCDARAAVGADLLGQSGVRHIKTIAAIVPKFNRDNPEWKLALGTIDAGAKVFIDHGHTDCGGLKGAIAVAKARIRGEEPALEEPIEQWIRPATEIALKTIRYIDAHTDEFKGVTDKMLLRMVTDMLKRHNAYQFKLGIEEENRLRLEEGGLKPQIKMDVIAAVYHHLDSKDPQKRFEFLSEEFDGNVTLDVVRSAYKRGTDTSTRVYLPVSNTSNPRECPLTAPKDDDVLPKLVAIAANGWNRSPSGFTCT